VTDAFRRKLSLAALLSKCEVSCKNAERSREGMTPEQNGSSPTSLCPTRAGDVHFSSQSTWQVLLGCRQRHGSLGGTRCSFSNGQNPTDCKIHTQQKSPEEELSALPRGKAIFFQNGVSQDAKHGSTV